MMSWATTLANGLPVDISSFQAANSLLNSPCRTTQSPPECSARSSVSRASFRKRSALLPADQGTTALVSVGRGIDS